jgi:hypothetical protein
MPAYQAGGVLTFFASAPRLSALVQPHPPPRLHHRRLNRCESHLQPEMQGSVVRVCEVGVGIAFEGGDLRGDLCEVAGGILGYVSVVSGARVSH